MANELPDLSTLQGTYGAWNPEAYTQARENQGLAQQFQQQKLAQEGNTTQEGFLRNQQSAAMNPMLLTQQGNVNTKGLQDNQSSALDLERKNAIQFQNLALDQQKAIYNMKDEDLKAIDQHGEELLRSNNPTERMQGQQIMEMGKSFREAKQQQNYALELEKQRNSSAANVANIHAKGATDVATINANRPRGGGSSSMTFIQKISNQKAADRLGPVKGILTTGIDPDTQQELSPAAQAYYKAMYDQDARTVEAKTAAQGQGTTLEKQADGSMVMVNKAPPSVRESPQKQPSHSLAELKAAYPGKSDADLRAAYKRKYGTEPQ